jgi:hypothetical protein
MSAVMMRSAAPHWLGRELAPNVHSLVKHHSGAPWKEVTWDEVHEKRRNWQAEVLRRKREWFVVHKRAIRISVRYFDIEVYTGWHTYIHGIDFSIWLRDRDGDERLMKMFPQPQPSLFGDRWQNWMVWFASTHQRGTFDGHPRGVVYCWALCEGQGKYTHVREILGEIK